MSATDREATQDYSRGISTPPGTRATLSARRLALLATGLLGGSLLIVADLSTLYEVDVLTVVKARVSGHDQHSYALLLVGLAALPMSVAVVYGSRPARPALALLGLLALLVALIAGDFHDVRSSGLIGRLYEDAAARPGPGFYYETLGAVLLILAGLAWRLPVRPRPVPAAAVPDEPPPGPGDPEGWRSPGQTGQEAE